MKKIRTKPVSKILLRGDRPIDVESIKILTELAECLHGNPHQAARWLILEKGKLAIEELKGKKLN